MILFVPTLVWIVGLVIFLVSRTPDVKEVGRIMFQVGLFIALLVSPGMVKLVTN